MSRFLLHFYVINIVVQFYFSIFFFNDTATTEIYTLSLHDALPILRADRRDRADHRRERHGEGDGRADRKSTRLNSSHQLISYAVFCLKKKNYHPPPPRTPAHPPAPAPRRPGLEGE